MALLHRADLAPGKIELLDAWLPTRPWYRGPAAPRLHKVSAFRFDDPDGAVGVETILVRAADPAGGPVYQTPLTYRDAPLDGAEAWLLGTAEHSVLGRRWVYDACGDPVYAAALAAAILTGGGEAEEFVDVDGRLEPRAPAMAVRGSGSATAAPRITRIVRVDDADPAHIVTDTVELAVARVPAEAADAPGETLRWGEVALARIVRS
jgi:hypothetical protein